MTLCGIRRLRSLPTRWGRRWLAFCGALDSSKSEMFSRNNGTRTTNEAADLRAGLGTICRRGPNNCEDAGRWAGRLVKQTRRRGDRSHTADANSRRKYERFATAVSCRSQARLYALHSGNPEGGCCPSRRPYARSSNHRIFASQAHRDRTSWLSGHLSERPACLRADANALPGPFHGPAIWRMHSLQLQAWQTHECQDVDANVPAALVF